MKILAFLLLLFPAVSFADPLLATWNRYRPTIPVRQLELWRAVGGESSRRYAIFSDITTTVFTDGAVKKNRTYCYSLRAISVSGVSSLPAPSVCARPRK